MADKTYSAFSGDKIMDLENENVVKSFQEVIGNNEDNSKSILISFFPMDYDEKDSEWIKWWAKDKNENYYKFTDIIKNLEDGVSIKFYVFGPYTGWVGTLLLYNEIENSFTTIFLDSFIDATGNITKSLVFKEFKIDLKEDDTFMICLPNTDPMA